MSPNTLMIVKETEIRAYIRKLINEAMKDSFSLDKLNQSIQKDLDELQRYKQLTDRQDMINDKRFNNTLSYCKQHFGEPLSNGSARVVFQIDDTRVIKIALNAKGVAQNSAEYSSYNESRCKWLQAIVFNDSDTNNFFYIIQEYALPLEESDFEHVLGIKFEVMEEFVQSLNYNDENGIKKIFSFLQKNNKVDALKTFRGLLIMSSMEHHLPGDWEYTDNWGMVKRNGKPSLVLIDNGLTDEIGMNYYGIYRH